MALFQIIWSWLMVKIYDHVSDRRLSIPKNVTTMLTTAQKMKFSIKDFCVNKSYEFLQIFKNSISSLRLKIAKQKQSPRGVLFKRCSYFVRSSDLHTKKIQFFNPLCNLGREDGWHTPFLLNNLFLQLKNHLCNSEVLS